MASPGAAPLILMDDGGAMSVHPEGAALLAGLVGPLSVVVVVGQYRTGKSFLMNALFPPSQQPSSPSREGDREGGRHGSPRVGRSAAPHAGFGVGHSVRAHTKGIWVRVVPSMGDDDGGSSGSGSGSSTGTDGDRAGSTGSGIGPGGSGSGRISGPATVLLDTEGLGAVDAAAEHDAQIFALALLLSSQLIYNSRGLIDAAALDHLSLVSNLTKHIRVKASSGGGGGGGGGGVRGRGGGGVDSFSNEGDGDGGNHSDGGSDDSARFHDFFPHFIWVVRDFSLQLNEGLNPITPRQYLEGALKPQGGTGDDAFAKNKIRMMIASFFPSRDCVTLVRPVGDEALLRELSAVDTQDLRPEFREGVERLRGKIRRVPRVKMMYGQAVTGPVLAQLAESYVAMMNDQCIPTIATAWERILRAQCDDAVEAAVAQYAETMRGAMSEATAKDGGGGGTSGGGGSTSGGGFMAGGMGDFSSRPRVLGTGEWLRCHHDARVDAERCFRRRCPDSLGRVKRETAHERLSEKLGVEQQRLMARNETESDRVCRAVLAAILREVAERGAEEEVGGASAGEGGRGRGGRRGGWGEEGEWGGEGRGGGVGRGGDSSRSDGGGAVGGALSALRQEVRLVVEVVRRYEADSSGAVGPCRDRVLSQYLVREWPARVDRWGQRSVSTMDALVERLKSRMWEQDRSLATVQGSNAAMVDSLAKEKAAFHRALDESSRHLSTQQQLLRVSESRQGDLETAMEQRLAQGERQREDLEALRDTVEMLKGEIVVAREGHSEVSLQASKEQAEAAMRAKVELLEIERRHHEDARALMTRVHDLELEKEKSERAARQDHDRMAAAAREDLARVVGDCEGKVRELQARNGQLEREMDELWQECSTVDMGTGGGGGVGGGGEPP